MILTPDVVTKFPNVFFAVKHKNCLFPPPSTSLLADRREPRGAARRKPPDVHSPRGLRRCGSHTPLGQMHLPAGARPGTTRQYRSRLSPPHGSRLTGGGGGGEGASASAPHGCLPPAPRTAPGHRRPLPVAAGVGAGGAGRHRRLVGGRRPRHGRPQWWRRGAGGVREGGAGSAGRGGSHRLRLPRGNAAARRGRHHGSAADASRAPAERRAGVREARPLSPGDPSGGVRREEERLPGERAAPLSRGPGKPGGPAPCRREAAEGRAERALPSQSRAGKTTCSNFYAPKLSNDRSTERVPPPAGSGLGAGRKSGRRESVAEGVPPASARVGSAAAGELPRASGQAEGRQEGGEAEGSGGGGRIRAGCGGRGGRGAGAVPPPHRHGGPAERRRPHARPGGRR